MRAVSRAAGVILAIIGLVWVLQGFDVPFAPQSFMTGDMTWVVLGSTAILAGAVLIWRSSTRRR